MAKKVKGKQKEDKPAASSAEPKSPLSNTRVNVMMAGMYFLHDFLALKAPLYSLNV